jgi:8-amino-7-oxononanoate synthase
MSIFKQELSRLQNRHLLRRLKVIESSDGRTASIDGKRVLLLCSNDYLGLAGHPALRLAAVEAMNRYGFGSGASRLVSGNSSLHQELEQEIALFKGTEAALVFNSGYAANTGVIPALAGTGDLILSDSLNHASIIDGCRLSKARTEVYRHRDVNHAELLLKNSQGSGRRLIVTDGVFSMDGDIAPLPDLVALAERYNALLMVDDAHATGVLGKSGRGTAEHFGLSGRVPIQMGTLGKALGSFGAYISGSRELIDYLVNGSRSFIFSTALPPAICAASIAALHLVEQEPALRARLWENRAHFAEGITALGMSVHPSETPIMPLFLGDSENTLRASEKLLSNGIYTTAIRPPTVAEGAARLRITVTSSHSEEDIDRALEIFSSLQREGEL